MRKKPENLISRFINGGQKSEKEIRETAATHQSIIGHVEHLASTYIQTYTHAHASYRLQKIGTLEAADNTLNQSLEN